MDLETAMARLEAAGDPASLAGMASYSIQVENAFGVRVPALRSLAREIGNDHQLALDLWETGNRDARILAALIDDPGQVTEAQMDRWAAQMTSWDVCDGCCNALFVRTPYAWQKAVEWSARPEEYVKRAGFVLMTQLAVHDKRAPDDRFEPFFPIIIRESGDGRNFVKKAVNWALRQIGKRNRALNARAIETARAIAATGTPAGRWIAADALRELESEAVQTRLVGRAGLP